MFVSLSHMSQKATR